MLQCLFRGFVLINFIQAHALADEVSDFYRDKTVIFCVGFPLGSGYDLYALVFAPHFGRHISGNAGVVVKNMPGGVGVRAAGYLTSAITQDGTSLGLFLDATTLSKALGGPGEFDPPQAFSVDFTINTPALEFSVQTRVVCSLKTRDLEGNCAPLSLL
jgi:tripartite-type tricarboxylate transporter receptor subunit TctC